MFSHPVEFFPLVTETPMVTEAGLMSIRIPASDAPEGHVDPRYICYMLSVRVAKITGRSKYPMTKSRRRRLPRAGPAQAEKSSKEPERLSIDIWIVATPPPPQNRNYSI